MPSLQQIRGLGHNLEVASEKAIEDGLAKVKVGGQESG
jgi:hypothetical protein